VFTDLGLEADLSGLDSRLAAPLGAPVMGFQLRSCGVDWPLCCNREPPDRLAPCTESPSGEPWLKTDAVDIDEN